MCLWPFPQPGVSVLLVAKCHQNFHLEYPQCKWCSITLILPENEMEESVGLYRPNIHFQKLSKHKFTYSFSPGTGTANSPISQQWHSHLRPPGPSTSPTTAIPPFQTIVPWLFNFWLKKHIYKTGLRIHCVTETCAFMYCADSMKS